MKSGIYKILNIFNGKFYIGSAINLKNRWKTHRNLLLRNAHPNTYMQFAWNNYGEEYFKFIIIENCEKNLLLIREQYWLDMTGANDRALGYNLCEKAGSRIGHKPSAETIIKMSISQKEKAASLSPEKKEKIKHWGNDFKKGKLNSELARQRMSKASKGKPKSEAHRQAIANAHKGKKKSAEHIAKIWASRKANAERLKNADI